MKKIMFAVFLLCLPLFAQAEGLSAISSGQQLSRPYREVDVPNDKNDVLVFISFSCPYCREYFPFFMSWGHSLPKQYNFKFVPIIDSHDKGTIAAAYYWEAAVKGGATPSQLLALGNTVFAAVAVNPALKGNEKFWFATVRSLGIANYGYGLQHVTADDINRDYRKFVQYKVVSTPTIAVGGQYAATPDNANGDPVLFSKLCSALVSMTMEQ